MVIKDYSDIDKCLKDLDAFATKALKEGYRVSVKWDAIKISQKQVNALNKWCRENGEVCNKAGHYRYLSFTGKKVPWKDDDWKDHVYKPFLKIYAGKDSTMDQNTSEPCECYLALLSHFQTEYGIELKEWPKI